MTDIAFASLSDSVKYAAMQCNPAPVEERMVVTPSCWPSQIHYGHWVEPLCKLFSLQGQRGARAAQWKVCVATIDSNRNALKPRLTPAHSRTFPAARGESHSYAAIRTPQPPKVRASAPLHELRRLRQRGMMYQRRMRELEAGAKAGGTPSSTGHWRSIGEDDSKAATLSEVGHLTRFACHMQRCTIRLTHTHAALTGHFGSPRWPFGGSERRLDGCNKGNTSASTTLCCAPTPLAR